MTTLCYHCHYLLPVLPGHEIVTVAHTLDGRPCTDRSTDHGADFTRECVEESVRNNPRWREANLAAFLEAL